MCDMRRSVGNSPQGSCSTNTAFCTPARSCSIALRSSWAILGRTKTTIQGGLGDICEGDSPKVGTPIKECVECVDMKKECVVQNIKECVFQDGGSVLCELNGCVTDILHVTHIPISNHSLINVEVPTADDSSCMWKALVSFNVEVSFLVRFQLACLNVGGTLNVFATVSILSFLRVVLFFIFQCFTEREDRYRYFILIQVERRFMLVPLMRKFIVTVHDISCCILWRVSVGSLIIA